MVVTWVSVFSTENLNRLRLPYKKTKKKKSIQSSLHLNSFVYLISLLVRILNCRPPMSVLKCVCMNE